MAVIFLNWAYILLTCYCTGHALLAFFAGRFKYEGRLGFLSVVFTGFSVITAYSGYFSIFYKVGLAANAVLCLAVAVCIYIDRKHYRELLVKAWEQTGKIKSKGIRIILFRMVQLCAGTAVFFVIIYFTCYGTFHPDSGLYHAQSIRWIEEYGVVKGLALVQNRFGYNSAFFSVSALYSFSFLGQSLHGVNGFMAMLVTLYAYFGITDSLSDKSFGDLHTITAIAPFLYTVIGGKELISPATDPILLYMVFGIIILWTELIDRDETDVMPYALLCVLTAFLVSVKLSVGVLVLLVVKPAIELVKLRRVKEIIVCLLAGVILNLPYFIRNVIISGWLIYPFPTIDLFDVPWKLPAESARHDADEITTWARYVRDASKIDQSQTEWVPVWWKGQTSIERFLSATAFLALAAGCVWCIIALIRLVRSGGAIQAEKDKNRLKDMLFTELIIILGFLFWFLSAPLIRYGYLYLLLVPVTTAAVFVNDKTACKKAGKAAAAVLILALIYPVGITAARDIEYIYRNWSSRYALYQQDYPVAETGRRDFGGVTFYYPKEPGTPVWYTAFPSVLYEDNFDHMEYSGESISDGFRLKGAE